jgi:glucose 1-dehydrogenase
MQPRGNRFIGKVCLITGSGSGIGRATALRFAAEGALVAVVDIDEASGRGTADQISATGGHAMFLKANVADSGDVKACIQAIVERWHRVDILVNDAAIMTFVPITELKEDEWDRVMSVNLRSVYLFCKYTVPHMSRGSAIVNVSSVHAHETTRNVVPYATSKGAMEAFTRGFSEELEHRKIRINCVAPGAVDTPMLRNNPNIASGAERISGAIGAPDDIAAVILFLASAEARFITGTTLVADGGRLDIL